MSSGPPPRGPVVPAVALGVLALVIALVLVVAVLAPGVGYLVVGVTLPLRLLGLLAGLVAIVFGVVVLRAASRGAGGRGTGVTALALGLLAVVGVVVAVPVVVGSEARAFQQRQQAAASAGPDRPAEQDVRVDRCAPVPSGYAAYLSITNSTDTRVRYDVTVEVLDGSGASRGFLVSADQSGVDPGATAQQVVEGSVGLGTDGSCRVFSASRGPA
ncbi:hypothetical protein [Quadrisphaera setariae]|uniref:Uncharacterized protein n=1 Tax=Quadrisphaera setariae TaxID=2593304 RepID=A0A5C8ZK02_9ACTN|nr:hypothetical protein [Quadrisphaera setariae]TXR57479.1 hypothetical protein FMM08_04365 [Quadrisphaera setariae]